MHDVDGFEQTGSRDYRHIASGLMFTLFDGGEFDCGMSEAEEDLLREHASRDGHDDLYSSFLSESLRNARPIRRIRLSPFLIANFPLTVGFTRSRWGIDPVIELADDHAAYFSNAEVIQKIVGELGLRLPSETEWEFCHRQCTTQGMPGEDALVHATTDHASGFGSYCELLADAWHPDLTLIPADGSPRRGPGRHAVRGGAMTDYPWQGCGEWLRLMPFFRYCEYDDDLLSVRPAASV